MDRALGIASSCRRWHPVRGRGDAGARLVIGDPRPPNANRLLGRLRLARIRNTLEGFGSYTSQVTQ